MPCTNYKGKVGWAIELLMPLLFIIHHLYVFLYTCPYDYIHFSRKINAVDGSYFAVINKGADDVSIKIIKTQQWGVLSAIKPMVLLSCSDSGD